MRVRLHECAFRGQCPGIGPETDPWLLQFPLDVLFRHEEINGVNAAVVLDDEIDCGLGRIRVALIGNFLQGFAG